MNLLSYSFFLGFIEVEDSEPVWNIHIEICGSNTTFKIDIGAKPFYWNGGLSGWDFHVTTEHQ